MVDIQDKRSGASEQAPMGAAARATTRAPLSRRVIRGKTKTLGIPLQATKVGTEIAHVDWFACTFFPPGNILSDPFLTTIEAVFCVPRGAWQACSGGWQGYRHRINLGGAGLLAHGGQTQRGTAHLEISGHGCGLIQDWNAVRVWCESYGARITRVDLAHDDFEGVDLNILTVLAWLRDGEFGTGGRSPTARLIDDLGSNKGKTLYIGQRQNGKMLRAYEKGKQLGDTQSPWFRIEVEYRGKLRDIPLDVLNRPADYLAGAYPCLATLSAQQEKIKTISKTAEVSYEHIIKCLRTQYGPALTVMAMVEAGDAFAVLEQVMRPGRPKRLANLPLPRGESRQGHAA